MNTSVLIPSRGRVSLLKNFLQSFVEKTDDLNQVEFLIKIDDDDVGSGYEQMLSENFKNLHYHLFVETRSSNLSQDYYNYLAKQAQGKVLWAVNDDCVLNTFHWDTILLSLRNQYKTDGKIFYFNVSVAGHSQNEFSPFPMLTREFVESMGYFHHHLIRTWDADIILWNCFNTLKNVFSTNRMVPAQEINLFHVNHAGDIGDETQEGMRKGHMSNGGYNAGVFNDQGLYYVVGKQLKELVDNGK